MTVTLKLDREGMETLAKQTICACVAMVQEVNEGALLTNRYLILGDNHFIFARYLSRGSSTHTRMIHITYTRKKGFRMHYFSQLASPGTDVWRAVESGLNGEA